MPRTLLKWVKDSGHYIRGKSNPKKFGDDFGTQHSHSRYYHDHFLRYHNFLLLFLSFYSQKKLNCIFCFPQHPTNSKQKWQSSEVLEGSLQLFQAPGVHQDPPWHSLKLTIFVPWKMLKKQVRGFNFRKIGTKKGVSGAFAVSLRESTKAVTPTTYENLPQRTMSFGLFHEINVATKSGVEKIRVK